MSGIIDCPPARGVLTIIPLTTANLAVVPVQPERNSLEGLLEFEDQVRAIRANSNPKLRHLVVPSVYRRCRAHDEALEILQKDYGDVLSDVVIPGAIGFHDASAQGKSIIQLDPGSKGAVALEALVKEIESLCQTTDKSE